MVSDVTSSSSTLTSPPTAGMFGPKTIFVGYCEAKWVKLFILGISFPHLHGAQSKLAHLLESSPATTDITYEIWLLVTIV